MHLTHGDERRVRSSIGVGRRLISSLATRWVRLVVTAAVAVLGVAGLAGPAFAQQGPTNYSFSTLDNAHDPTFNQLLGINQKGIIAGYFGSGAQGAPNKGYLLFPPDGQGDYLSENFPGSVQTQVTGLNDRGVTVGFWSNANNANPMTNPNFGFYTRHGRAHEVNFPGSTAGVAVPFNQLLGVNDDDVAVGVYTDANGNMHGYTYSINRRRFRQIDISGAMDTATNAINNRGAIAGTETDQAGTQHGFLLQRDGQVTILDPPGASSTMALGVNDWDEVVGVYTVNTAMGQLMHGFTWTQWGGFQTVDDPNGIGTTTINGVNDRGQLVGFYTDANDNNNTEGMLATPVRDH